MKAKNLFIIFLVSMMLFIPTNALAVPVINNNSNQMDVYDGVGNGGSGEAENTTTIIQESEDMTQLCKDENFISLIKLIRTIIYLLIYAAAIVLVIRGVLIFVGALTSEKVEMDKAFKSFGSKLVLGVVVLILPTLFNWIFFSDNIFVQGSTYYKTCVNRLSDGKFFPELNNGSDEGNGSAGSGSASPSKNSGNTSNQANVAN